jgi:hypothetical protein
MKILKSWLLATLVFSSLAEGSRPKQTSRWEWENVPRVVAIGDIHGSYEKLTSLLKTTGLATEALTWKGGEAHLVACGDLVDRGSEDRAVLDLLRKLQKEAEKEGGQVHTLLGNHDVMNLVRDLRYVAEDSYADFVDEERSGDRRKGWQGFLKSFKKPKMDTEELRDAFEERYPPGYFGRVRAFTEKGKYGSWLLKQPGVIKVNGVIFVHGGLTPEVAAMGLNKINSEIQESVRKVMRSSQTLEELLFGPATYGDFYAAAKYVQDSVKKGGQEIPHTLVFAADELQRQRDGLPFRSDGPLWHRRNSLENERAEREPVKTVLARLNAKAMVVGHTPTDTGRITSRFNGQLYRADVGMAYGGEPFALVLEQDITRVFDPATGLLTTPIVEEPPGQGWDRAHEHIPDLALEEFLATAKVNNRRVVSRGQQQAELWELEGEGLELLGVFKDTDEAPPTRKTQSSNRYQHELAAYWLDRKLGLEMVPVTVVRSIDGQVGALRVVIEAAVDLVSIRSYKGLEGVEGDELRRGVAQAYKLDLEDLEEQVRRAWAFDALIGLQDRREDEDALLIPGEKRIALVDHERAFSISPTIDPEIPSRYCPFEPDLEVALQALTLDELESNLSPYLSRGQIDALLLRRDRILESCSRSD